MAEVSLKKAVAYTAVAKYTTAALQIVFAAILSRLLTPEQFGTVAVINVFVVFFQLFCDMGFGTAVIQDKDLSEEQTNDIFSWTVYLGIVLMILFVFASYPLSRIYDDPIYIPLGTILSLTLLLHALNMIPGAVMLKQKRFKSITFRTITSNITASLLTIALAFKGFGVYALVLQSFFTVLIVFIWNELSAKLKFYSKPNLLSIKRIWGYSIYQFLAQLLNYFNRNLDNLLIGKFFSKADLGQYNKSYYLTQLPLSYIPGVVGPALHPILSEHQHDPQYIYKAYLRILKLLSLIGCFVSVYLYYNGTELILLLYGDQWHQAILPFKILALSVWFQLITNTFGPIYLSIGKTMLMFKSVVCASGIILSAIIIGCMMGNIVLVASCVSVAYVLNFFVSFFIMVRYGFNENLKKLFFIFWHEVIIFTTMMMLTLIPLNIGNLMLSLVIKTVFITAAYVILLVITGQHKPFLSLLHRNKS